MRFHCIIMTAAAKLHFYFHVHSSACIMISYILYREGIVRWVKIAVTSDNFATVKLQLQTGYP